MLVMKAMQLFVAAWALQLQAQPGDAAAAASVKLCGRKLSEIMSRVCHVYNSPSWDDPTVVEQPGTGPVRRKRQIGIADQCCTFGCTWEQLNEYCAISSNSESPLDELEARMVEEGGRGAEFKRDTGPAPREGPQHAPEPEPEPDTREVGRGRRRGPGRGRARGRRCWCRRKRRSGRRRTLMGNMKQRQTINDTPDPVVGTVSPVLRWGRTLNTDLPPMELDRYNYIAVYT